MIRQSRGDERLPRAKRIRRRGDFLRIQSTGLRTTTPHFVVLAVPRDGDEPARLGIVASRRAGVAVARNRAKRLVREAFRRRPELFPPNTDVVVIVRSGAHELGVADVEAEFARVAKRLAARTRRARTE